MATEPILVALEQALRNTGQRPGNSDKPFDAWIFASYFPLPSVRKTTRSFLSRPGTRSSPVSTTTS